MHSALHKLGATLLAFMVLFSTMSFSMDMHFCGKNLVDFKLFQEANTCGMEMPGMEMEISGMENHCCSDLALVIPGQDDLQGSIDTFTPEQQAFFIAFAYSYLLLLSDTEVRADPFKDYAPPPLIRDVQVLDQTFLI